MNEVSDFFKIIYKAVKDVEREVMTQVRNSQSIKQMKVALDLLDKKINHSVMDKLEEEKNQLDLKVDANRFAYVVKHKEHYDEIEQKFDTISSELIEQMADVQKFAKKSLVIKY